MTVVEAAEKYGVPHSTLHGAIRRGELAYTVQSRRLRGGRRYDVRALDVRRWKRDVWRPKAA